MCSEEGLGRVAGSRANVAPGNVTQPRTIAVPTCVTTGRRHARLKGATVGLGESVGFALVDGAGEELDDTAADGEGISGACPVVWPHAARMTAARVNRVCPFLINRLPCNAR